MTISHKETNGTLALVVMGHGRAEATGRVLAAAPALLEALEHTVAKLGRCQADPLNPCWNNRPTDRVGKHWGGTDACAYCHGQGVLAQVAP